MKGLVGWMLVLLTGCSQSQANTPEAIVAAVYTLCQEGAYSKALPYYSKGKEVWDEDPSTAKYVIDKSCHSRQATSYKVDTAEVEGEGAVIRVLLYAKASDTPPLRTVTYELLKRKGRWQIIQVV